MVSMSGKSDGSVNRLFTLADSFVPHEMRLSDIFWHHFSAISAIGN